MKPHTIRFVLQDNMHTGLKRLGGSMALETLTRALLERTLRVHKPSPKHLLDAAGDGQDHFPDVHPKVRFPSAEVTVDLTEEAHKAWQARLPHTTPNRLGNQLIGYALQVLPEVLFKLEGMTPIHVSQFNGMRPPRPYTLQQLQDIMEKEFRKIGPRTAEGLELLYWLSEMDDQGMDISVVLHHIEKYHVHLAMPPKNTRDLEPRAEYLVMVGTDLSTAKRFEGDHYNRPRFDPANLADSALTAFPEYRKAKELRISVWHGENLGYWILRR